MAGVDYSSIVLNPSAPGVQDYIVFTYDDYQSGQASKLYPRGNNHIVSIREGKYKLAKYYDPGRPGGPYDWEMYNLEANPEETDNLAYRPEDMPAGEKRHFDRLQKKLADVEATRLKPPAGAATAS
jgi:choline-sulfatase